MRAVIPREGSSLYYSLLWTEEPTRQRFLERLAMLDELSGTLDVVNDADVAQKKIHWWHEEIERLIKGQARHPSLQKVAPSLSGRRQALKPLIDILSSVASSRFTPAVTDQEASTRLCSEYRGRLRLLAHSLDEDDTTLGLPSDSLDPLALAFGAHDQLFRLPSRLKKGHALFSDEFYAKHALGPEQLLDGTLSEPDTELHSRRQALIQEAVIRAELAFRQVMDNEQCMRFLNEAAVAPLSRLARLRSKQLQLWLKRKPDLLRERMTLTPVRKWYLAWRVK